jgi:hypothetical protein
MKRASKNKKSTRRRKAPEVVIVSELPERRAPGKDFDLRERAVDGRRTVEFPQIKGRIVQNVRFYTSADQHTLSVRFRDRTILTLNFEPGFILRSNLTKPRNWELHTIKEWPRIHSAPRNPELEDRDGD